MSTEERLGIDELRLLVSNLNACNETFNQEHTAEELLKIGRALWASEWDILPDAWTAQQVQAAIDHGTVPTWSDGEHALAVTDCHCRECRRARVQSDDAESDDSAS